MRVPLLSNVLAARECDAICSVGVENNKGDKMTTIRHGTLAIAAIAALSVLVSQAYATIITTPDSSSGPFVLTPATLGSVATVTSSGDAIESSWSQNLAILNDGSLGAATDPGASNDSIGIKSSNTSITYTFDTTTNSRGYDITGIQTYAGWLTSNGSGDIRSNQGYQVDLTFVGGATATLVGKTSFPWNTTGFSLPATLWTEVAFTSGGGVLDNGSGVVATGVKSITFTNFDSAVPGGPVAYREIHLDGAATVPEPGTVVLLGSGLLGLLAYAWRKQK